MKSVGAMIKQLHALDGTGELSTWQQSFVRSIWHQNEGARTPEVLTEIQLEVVVELYGKHFGDA